MSALIDMSNNRANFAFLGSVNDIWHRMGTPMLAGESIETWGQRAGLDHEVIKVLLWAGNQPASITEAPQWRGLQRTDTLATLGICTNRYQVVQPMQCLHTLDQHVACDPRFAIDAAGGVKGGAQVWATATFKEPVAVAGERHIARLLMTTTYDGTGSSVLKATMVRVVCNNTLQAALGRAGAEIRVRHTTKFDAERASRDLAAIVKNIDQFKAMGDAMAETHMAKDVTSKFFKALLDIPFDTKAEDVSARKLNQFESLKSAYRTTVAEGTQPDTAWAALNTVTRYVDHDRSVRGGDEGVARFTSAQFGTGAAMKAQAVHLLTEDSTFAELLKRPFVASAGNGGDLTAILKQPFRAAAQ